MTNPDPFESATPAIWVGNPQPDTRQPSKPKQQRPDPKPDKLPPHSSDAELGVLGCIILSPQECLAECEKQSVSMDWFYDLRHGTIFLHCLLLYRRSNPVDVITIYESLKSEGMESRIGGIAFLASLPDSVPSAANLSYYLELLKEKWMLRNVVRICTETVGRVYEYSGDTKNLMGIIGRDLSLAATGMSNSNGHLPPIVHIREFMEREIIPPDELIKGVLHQGTKMVLGGGSKSFKTWIQLDVACSVACGMPWLGFPTVMGKVLFVNFEIQPAFFQQRLLQVAYHKQAKIALHHIDIWNLRGYSAPYHEIVPEISRRIKSEGYSLVILDPIYKLYGKTDENNASEVAELLNSLETLCTSTKAAIAFGAHYSKGNQSQKESIDRISGSGVFARDPDSIISFTRHEEPDCFTVEPVLRNLEPIHPFVVRWKFPLMIRDDTLDPNDLKQSKGKPGKGNPLISHSRIRELCVVAGSSKSDLVKLIIEDSGCARQNAYRYLAAAEGEGLIKWSSQNERYFRS